MSDDERDAVGPDRQNSYAISFSVKYACSLLRNSAWEELDVTVVYLCSVSYDTHLSHCAALLRPPPTSKWTFLRCDEWHSQLIGLAHNEFEGPWLDTNRWEQGILCDLYDFSAGVEQLVTNLFELTYEQSEIDIPFNPVPRVSC